MANFGDTTAVRASIQRLLPIGLLVRLDDGRSGLIREREIAWDYLQRQGWQQRFKVGDRVYAVPIGDGLDQRLELSLRRAVRDPWDELSAHVPVGRVIDGVVVGLQHYGVFVELWTGIIGLLHVTRLPLWAQSRDLSELFWPGDTIKVVAERIDLRSRHIRLSVSQALHRRWARSQQRAVHDGAGPAEPVEPVYSTDLSEPLLPPMRALVLEGDPAQREAVANWLRRSGLQIWSAGDAATALDLLDRQPFDIVLADFSLPEVGEGEALSQLRARWPATRRVLMTDWAQINSHLPAIEAARAGGAQLLIKPLRPEDLIEVITELPDQAQGQPAAAAPAAAPAVDGLLQAVPFQLQRRPELLERLRVSLRAEKVVLFSYHPGQGRVVVAAEAGAPQLNAAALTDLIHSPVRDVAEDGDLFRIDDAQQAERRVRYLKPLLPFRACVGVSVPAQLAERYGLFAFGAAAFDDSQLDFTTATAWALATLLEREQFYGQMFELQRLALLGQLSRALVHELNHQLSPVNFVLHDMRQQMRRIDHAAQQGAVGLGDELPEIRDLLLDMDKGIRRLTEVARLFGRMTVQMGEQLIYPQELIDDVIYLVRDSADRANINVEVEVAPEVGPARLPVTQLQQILLNVVINAIQQIVLLRPGEGGRVRISARAGEESGRPLLTLEVEDDGPGIHHQLWPQIFELGFTTRREGGSGIGLYVTRSLTEALGGRVYIRESAILWGTALVIELPLRQ